MSRLTSGFGKRARAVIALIASLALHGLVTLAWRAPRRTESSGAAEAAVTEPPPVVFVPIIAPLLPPIVRRPSIVIVGPESAGRGGTSRGGSPRGSARTSPPLAPSPSPAAAPPPSQPPAEASAEATDRDVAVVAPDHPSDVPVPVAHAGQPEQPPSTADRPASPVSDPDRASEDRLRSLLLAAGRGRGHGGFGQGNGPNGLTLAIDLSGRRVVGSRVAANPVVLQEQRVACELAPGRLRAVVRLLVLRDGTGAAPRVLESSGQQSFDACALRYALALRFAPGVDGTGRPIDVWVHVGVTPAATNRL